MPHFLNIYTVTNRWAFSGAMTKLETPKPVGRKSLEVILWPLAKCVSLVLLAKSRKGSPKCAPFSMLPPCLCFRVAVFKMIWDSAVPMGTMNSSCSSDFTVFIYIWLNCTCRLSVYELRPHHALKHCDDIYSFSDSKYHWLVFRVTIPNGRLVWKWML